MSAVREMYSLGPVYDLNAKVDLPTSMYSLPVIQSSAGENIQAHSVREMYSLGPVYDLNAKVDLPTSMYSLPVIQSSAGENIQPSEASSGSQAGYMDALEKRQESILARLGQLKDQVSAYKQSIGLGPVPDAKTTSTTSSGASPSKGCGCIADIVIKASPSNPPLSLPTVCSLLQANGYAVFMSTHIHSSVTANKPKTFLPPTVAGLSRGQADVRVTLIWAEVLGDCELMISPLTQSVIKGEVNILRYFARVFDDEFMYESSPNCAAIDCMLDTISSLPYSIPKNRPPMLRSVTTGLSKSANLTGEDITIADLALFSYLKQADQAKDLHATVKKWLDSMNKWSEELSADEGKKKSPRRRNYRRSHRNSQHHKEGPPEKKHRESEKEKSPQKPVKEEKSPQKPIKEKSPQKPVKEKSPQKSVKVEKTSPQKAVKEEKEGAICKNLFLKDDRGDLYLLTTAKEAKDVNLNDVANQVGAKEVEFGPENIMNDKAVKFLVDASLVDGTYKMVTVDTANLSTENFKKILQMTEHQVLKL